ncbi:ADP-heptose:LPS heptosyltransferase [Ignavibacterium album JCM 16511]|uniref:ADP-heptose:LPS heptosyltransferase n=1 Tax=Ignavibacterium album (strain DSM 19864 / JCM 16511 / NBRC 101810 / Mat9-16) TaxID=945713 RepID=I0AM69_IGNAJ|nr:glycosyltransferase family 9 protein [Ignavibacterium album]AFH50076.1 ADP-heptose:LPS heptosyltransferase [Ignavibacterium album JCM 16511]
MAKENFLSDLIIASLRKLLEVPEKNSTELTQIKKILIVRQHNQLGDLLAGISLLRAIKEKFPDASLTIILSKENFKGLLKNRFIDEHFVFDKTKLFNPFYLIRLIKLLRRKYDAVFVPVTVSISFTSNLLARISNSKIRVGPKSLDGKINDSQYFFDRRINIDWRKHPDSHVAERILDLVRPFGIDTNDFTSEINFDDNDISVAKKFLSEIKKENSSLVIGLHVGAGKPQNRWSLQKYVELIELLNQNFNCTFFLTGSDADNEELNYVKSKSLVELPVFKNMEITQVAALISLADLFITNDTGTMHIAGSTKTPQISLFGPTNPYNWAPIGANKFFIRKTELIDDITVQDVYELASQIIKNRTKDEN